MKKSNDRTARDRARVLDDYFEVARASRASKLVPAYNPVVVFSLSASGKVRQAMTFRRPEDDYAHGSGWNLKEVGATLDAFTAWAAEHDLELDVRKKPKRINYEKSVSMHGVRKRAEGAEEQEVAESFLRKGRSVSELSDDEKAVEAQVIGLRLEGLSYKKIEARMGQDGKRGFWAMKIIRRAEALAE